MERLTPLYGRDEAQAMMRAIMLDVYNLTPVDMLLRADSPLPAALAPRLDDILARLERHEPLQYVLGKARFHGHDILVTPATLIPRPETEMLVDIIVDECGDRDDLRVLDIGTGSGCIAVALARALRFPVIEAVDVSDDALAVARENARRLNVSVTFAHLDILHAAPGSPRYDIIVSNPPYVMLSEAATMERNVLDYEPHGALFVPDDNPLLYYRAIARHAAALVPGGRLYLEINPLQADAVIHLLRQTGFTDCRLRRDQYGRYRFATAVWIMHNA